jgi:hypothetical protein
MGSELRVLLVAEDNEAENVFYTMAFVESASLIIRLFATALK